MNRLSAVAILLLGAGLYAGATGDIPAGEAISSTSELSGSKYQKATVREIVNNPVKYEGELVRVTGKSNSFQDFISSGGYTLEMDCSKYPDFNYAVPSGFVAKGVIELENPGQSGPRLRCLEPPQALD